MGDLPSEDELQAAIVGEVSWADIVRDGVITLDEIDAALRARGVDPEKFDHLYE